MNESSFLGDKRVELTEILRSRLIECGWRDQVSSMCRNMIQKHGVENIRLEQIYDEVRPYAKSIVPDQVKAEVLDMIKKSHQTQAPMQSQQPQSQQQQSNLDMIPEPSIDSEPMI